MNPAVSKEELIENLQEVLEMLDEQAEPELKHDE